MSDEQPERRPRGRPRVDEHQHTPVRKVRVASLWDDCAARAKDDGETMTDFVKEALRRELARRERTGRRRVGMHVEDCDCLDATAVGGGVATDPRCSP